MNTQTDAEIGSTVYLFPATKTAPAACYRQLAAVLVSTDRWPMVTVRIFDNIDQPRGRELDLHRLNVRIHRRTTAAKHNDGDGANSDAAPLPVRTMGRPVPQVDPDSGYEQDLLF